MFQQRTVSLTTDGTGAATGYSNGDVGIIRGVFLERDATAAPDATLDVTITDSLTGRSILALTDVAASASYSPTDLADDLAGADRTGIAVGIPIFGPVKIVLAQGGSAKILRVHLLVES